MRSDRFHPLLTARGPFVSVYFDDFHDTADALAQLNARWRDLYKHLEDAGVDPAVISRLEDAVLHHRPAVGRRGRGIIATAEKTFVNEQLTEPPPVTTLRISDYPYILPLVEFGSWRPTYIVAAVDHAGADVILHQGDVVRTHAVDGGGYPVHKSRAAEGEFAHPQPRVEEAIRKNVRAVADKLTELVRDTSPEVVFVAGEVRSRTDVVSALPERVAQLVHQRMPACAAAISTTTRSAGSSTPSSTGADVPRPRMSWNASRPNAAADPVSSPKAWGPFARRCGRATSTR